MRASRQRRQAGREEWRARLWPLPALGIALAVLVGVALPRADAVLAGDLPDTVTGYLFSGGPEAARTVLSVLAGSLITVTALTFSLTVVTLQLAASQFSPRLLRTFTRDPMVQATLALLLGTFTYAVTVLRTVRSDTASQPGFVPQLSVTLAFLLGLIAVVALVAFLAHLVRQIRIEPLLDRVAAETTTTAHRLLDQGRQDRPAPAAAPGAKPVCARSTGFITAIDEPALLAAAVDAGAVIILNRRVGDWLVNGTPLAHAWPLVPGVAADPTEYDELARSLDGALTLGPERTAAQDLSFGLRQLTDVAVKALSPGINDPTTAIHALNHASALLCDLTRYRLGPRLLHDDHQRPRVIIAQQDFADLLELAVGQPRRYGAPEPDIQARLLTLLREIAWRTTDVHIHNAIRSQLEKTQATTSQQPHYTSADRARLEHLARQAYSALAGRWGPPEQV